VHFKGDDVMGKNIGKKLKDMLKDDIFDEEYEDDSYDDNEEAYEDESYNDNESDSYDEDSYEDAYDEVEEDTYEDDSYETVDDEPSNDDIYELLGKTSEKKEKQTKKETKSEPKSKSKSNSKKKKSDVRSFALVFSWLLFILLAVVFYFYFMKDLPFFSKEEETTTEAATTEASSLDLPYQVNANPDINTLISQFLSYIVAKDEAGIRTLVVDPNGNVQHYLDRSMLISNFTNINCYTLPGYTEDATLVYVIYNITIPNVVSEHIDIQQFYVINTENGYKIDNREYSPEVAAYIEEQLMTDGIQGLYGLVQESINQSIQNDPTFAEFYQEIFSVTESEDTTEE